MTESLDGTTMTIDGREYNLMERKYTYEPPVDPRIITPDNLPEHGTLCEFTDEDEWTENTIFGRFHSCDEYGYRFILTNGHSGPGWKHARYVCGVFGVSNKGVNPWPEGTEVWCLARCGIVSKGTASNLSWESGGRYDYYDIMLSWPVEDMK